ncbi:MAG TPA: L-lactate dehydrogenase [Patescibacteria group bacterium]|nr:L-lactate dehydrogenase [Patescibacteria group bacterium]
MYKPRVFIVGAGGMVGATAAQVLAIKEVVQDIILIDVAEDLVRGQAMDINHATAYTDGVHVRVGSYSEIAEDDIVVLTCGAPQQPGQSRLELLESNSRIVKDVVGKVMAQGAPVYILVVANPVDILTYVALKASGLPKERVFGTGTSLDTARLRVILANALHVSQQQIEAYVLGEHGDSSFPALSQATIGGIPLAEFPGFDAGKAATIEQNIRSAAYEIIEAKHSTYYGIGHVVAKIVEAMVRDVASIYPLCSMTAGEYGLNDVVIGLPSLVNNKGVKILDKYPLDDSEMARLDASAAIISAAIKQL